MEAEPYRERPDNNTCLTGQLRWITVACRRGALGEDEDTFRKNMGNDSGFSIHLGSCLCGR